MKANLFIYLVINKFKDINDVILLNNPLQLGHQKLVDFMAIITFFFGRAAIVYANFFIRIVQLHRFTLVFLVEVDNEERVLKIDEEVAHVSHFLRFFFVCNNIEC